MKRLFLLSAALLLALSACNAKASAPAKKSAQELLAQDTADYFVADEDFVATNFGCHDYLVSAKVYLSKSGDGREFGFFELTDREYSVQMQQIIKDYLASEEQSIRSLAALYPADELQARLARFAKATVASEGVLVYYVLTD